MKTLKANAAEAAELKCENRMMPWRAMKDIFYFIKSRFLGEAYLTDTKEYKVNGAWKSCQLFYTRDICYAAVYDYPGMKVKHLVGAYKNSSET